MRSKRVRTHICVCNVRYVRYVCYVCCVLRAVCCGFYKGGVGGGFMRRDPTPMHE